MTTLKQKDSFLFRKQSVKQSKNARIYSYDIMRGLAIVFMILIHVMHVYAIPEVEGSVVGYIIEFMGGPPAAPTFMMLMGIFFIYSNKGTTRMSISRGFNILLVAVVLNLVRGVIPYYFLTEIKGVSLSELGRYFTLEFLIFEVDILTFAGLSYMFMAILYHFFKKPVYWLAFAIIIAFGSPLLWQIKASSATAQYALNMLWGDEYLSTFPMFPWLTFPLIGMVIGRWLEDSTDQKATINKMGKMSVFFMVIGLALILLDTDIFYNAYGKMGIGAIIAIVGFVFFWQWLITKIYKASSRALNTGFLMFLSKNTLTVYFVHWVICKWGVYALGIDSAGYLGVLGIFICVTILTVGITKAYNWVACKRV